MMLVLLLELCVVELVFVRSWLLVQMVAMSTLALES